MTHADDLRVRVAALEFVLRQFMAAAFGPAQLEAGIAHTEALRNPAPLGPNVAHLRAPGSTFDPDVLAQVGELYRGAMLISAAEAKMRGGSEPS